jgi:2,3-bisphosphoglycerate-independent phosphoglycerate mutase
VLLAEGGGLADIAPTLLHILDLPRPAGMTGTSLILPAATAAATPAGRLVQPLGA